jgi:HEAT repeat protein
LGQRYRLHSVTQDQLVAIQSIAALGACATSAVPSLVAAMDKPKLTYAAMYGLQNIGAGARPAVPKLCTVLREKINVHNIIGSAWRGGDPDRRQVLRTIAAIGPGAAEAVPILSAYLDQFASTMQEVTNYCPTHDAALQIQCRTNAILITKIEKNNRLLAAYALWRVSPRHENKVVEIIRWLAEGEEFWDDATAVGSARPVFPIANRPPGGRSFAAKILGEIGNTSAIPILEKLSTDNDANVRSAALDAIVLLRKQQK